MIQYINDKGFSCDLITCQKRISCTEAEEGTPSGHMGMTIYTANLSLAFILLAIFSANSIGIKLSAPDHRKLIYVNDIELEEVHICVFSTGKSYRTTCFFVSRPSIWWSEEILILNIYEVLGRSDCLDVCCLDALVYYQIFGTNKILH